MGELTPSAILLFSYDTAGWALLLGVCTLLLLCLGYLFFNARKIAAEKAAYDFRFRQMEEQSGNLKAQSNESLRSLNELQAKLVDATAQRDNLEKSSFARDRYLAAMSQEMRTPLNVITGLTHLLLDHNPRTDQMESLRTLQFAANDLVVFINDVLDFSKIEAGKLQLEHREFSPYKAIHEVKVRFEPMMSEKGLIFRHKLDTRIPEAVVGDNLRLQQIISNLLNNSYHNTSSGFVNLGVGLFGMDEREAFLKITVRDSRENYESPLHFETVSEDNIEQEDTNPQQLNIAIARRLVELQNGKFSIELQQEGGVGFTALMPFKLPLKQADVPGASAKKDYSRLTGSSILVVEDNPINRLVVTKMLQKIGVRVVSAENGLVALERFERDYFDLVLMDIQMPQLDGYKTTAEIRRHPDPSKRDTPVIALTSSAFLTEKEKAQLFGMNDHVGKPFSPEELLEKIGALLMKMHEKDANRAK